MASSAWKLLRAAEAMDTPRRIRITYIASTSAPKMTPNCSQMTAKMQSVKYTGITRGAPRPRPTPNSPPEAMAMSICTI